MSLKIRLLNILRVVRRLFRWIRCALWVVLLCTMAAVFWLHWVGFPTFLSNPVVNALRERGIEMRFGKLNLGWFGEIHAHEARLDKAGQGSCLQFSAREVTVHPDPHRLLRLRFDLKSVDINDGSLICMLAETNAPGRELVIDHINSTLNLLPGDTWHLDRFTARFCGARFDLTGSITNASALSGGRPPVPAQTNAPPATGFNDSVREMAHVFDQIRFASPPEVSLALHGDARDWQTFRGVLTMQADGAQSPWGSISSFLCTALLRADTVSHRLPVGRFQLRSAQLQTRWGSTRDTDLSLEFDPLGTNEVNVRMMLQAGHTRTKWAEAAKSKCNFHWIQSVTNPVPREGGGELEMQDAGSPWLQARRLQSSLNWRGPADTVSADAVLSLVDVVSTNGRAACLRVGAQLEMPWNAAMRLPFMDSANALLSKTNLEACSGSVNVNMLDGAIHGFDLQSIQGEVFLSWPMLTISNLDAGFGGGRLKADAGWSAESGQLQVRVVTDADVQKAAPLMPPGVAGWIQRFAYAHPPQLEAQGRLRLPLLTSPASGWGADILPTLQVNGSFDCGPGSYTGLAFNSARGHLVFSNQCLNLPDLHLTRPEGEAFLEHMAGVDDIYWKIDATAFPQETTPILGRGSEQVLALFHFNEPAHFTGEVWARKRRPGIDGLKGEITCSNFTFRGEPMSSLHARAIFTNLVLDVLDPRIVRPDGSVQADRVRVDFNEDWLAVTNGISSTDPMAVARIIGPEVVRALKPYQFGVPPETRVTGVVPLHGVDGTDMRFEVSGGPFQWWRFNLTNVTSTVHYMGRQVAITNAEGAFYQGRFNGTAFFDWSGTNGTRFRFDTHVTNASLGLLLHDLSTRSNHMEGVFNGRLTITNANADDWDSWNGDGEAILHDGTVWEFPMFGLLSPMLNGLSAGLGNGRFTQCTGSASISNSVIHFQNVDMQSPLLRLDCDGSVDFHERLDARVEAAILRDTWLIGPILSTVFWPVSKALAFHVTGTLSEPKVDLANIPKALLFPLHPIRTIRDLFGSGGGTNSPPEALTPPPASAEP
jgi:hypothetical protein